MFAVMKSTDRFHTDAGWLDSRHTFSFGEHYDPHRLGFGALRVINEDRVEPGQGFGTHPHRDMEILSYVVEGSLGHRDSMGTGSVIRPGDVQRMTAGTGVRHSEMNASRTEPVHFLQIWIIPEKPGLTPGYEQKTFPTDEKRGVLRLVASRDGREGSVVVHQDVSLYATVLGEGAQVTHRPAEGRRLWVQVIRGAFEVGGQRIAAGDGAAFVEEAELVLTGRESDSEALVFDLA